MNTFKIPWWRQLRVHLALGSLLGLGVLGLLVNLWNQQGRQQDLDGYMQWQDAGLASYIAARRVEPWLDAQGQPTHKLMRDTGMYVGMINPSLEIYLLDTQGRILDHTLEQAPAVTQIALEPLQRMLQSKMPLPIYGPDPRAPATPNLFSVARIAEQGVLQGYLYVVLRGQKAAALARSAAFADQLRSGYGSLLLALGYALLLMVWLQGRVTRRLQALMQTLLQYREHSGNAGRFEALELDGTDGRNDELDVVVASTRAMQQRIDAQFQALDQADSMRRELISNIAHDLHTPLASIQGYIETVLLNDARLSTAQRGQHLRTSLQHCKQLANRVADLFELSKLDSGQAALTLEPYCLAELLNDMVCSYQLSAEQAGVALRLSEDMDRQAKVLVDIALMERVFQNLLDNALRHTPRGGSVEIAVHALQDAVQVVVRDTGYGIAEQDLPHIFERYWSRPEAPAAPGAPSAAGKPCRTSSGLGLAIVQRILSLHGSIIRVRSEVLRGTEFSFSLACA